MSSTKEDRNKGQAIVDLVTWIKSEGTAKALDALQLLDLSDEDVETLFKNHASERVVRIPFLGKCT